MSNEHTSRSVAHWRKASYSTGENACVEIGQADAWFGLRDTKLHSSPELGVTAEQGRAFLDTIKRHASATR